MKNKLWMVVALFCLFLISGCGDGEGGMYGTGSGSGGSTNQGQVLLGPVVGATVTVRELYDESETILCQVTTVDSEEGDLDVAGTFSLPVGCVENSSTLYLLTASGGFDIDVDDDGVIDDVPTAVTEEVHSVVNGYQLYQYQEWKISSVTDNVADIAVYGKEQLDLTPSQLTMALELAGGNHLSADINGNEYTDYADILQWNPRDDQSLLTDDAAISEEDFYEKHEILLNNYQAEADLEGTWVVLSYNFHGTTTPIDPDNGTESSITGRYKEVCIMEKIEESQYRTNCFQEQKPDLNQLSWRTLTFENGTLKNEDGSIYLQVYDVDGVADYQQLGGQAILMKESETHVSVNHLYNAQMRKIAPLQTDIGTLTLSSNDMTAEGAINFYLELEVILESGGFQIPALFMYAGLNDSTTQFYYIMGGCQTKPLGSNGTSTSCLSNTLMGNIANQVYFDNSDPVEQTYTETPDESLFVDVLERSTTGVQIDFSGTHTNNEQVEVGPDFSGSLNLSFGFLDTP